MHWSKSVISQIIPVLNKHTTVLDAIEELLDSNDFDATITPGSLRKAFNHHGFSSPKAYLKQNWNPTIHVDYSDKKKPKACYDNYERKVNKILAAKPQKNKTIPSLDILVDSSGNPYRGKNTTTENIDPKMESFLSYIANKKYSLTDICNKLNCSPASVENYIEEATKLGYSIRSIDNNIFLNKKDTTSVNIPKSLNIQTNSNKIVRFGVISDTHFGSDAARCEEIQDFIKKAYVKYGIRTIVHCGDILTGNSVYKGQIAELSKWGCEKQCKEADKWMPKLDGLEYYAILGNHDLDFIKSSGINPGFVLSEMREDFHILGNIKASFILGDTGLVVEAIHIKSSAYAKSYPLEKHLAKTLSKLDSPDIVLAGHRHISGYFELNHVHCFQVPSFEDANFFVHYNDFIPSVGGLIIELHLNEENQIIQCIPMFINYHTKKQLNQVVQVKHVHEI